MSEMTSPDEITPNAAEIPPLRSNTRGLFRRLPLSIVLPSAAAGAVAGTLTIALNGELWLTLGVGFAIAALGAVRRRKTNIWRILGMRLALRWRNWRGTDSAPRTEPFAVPIPESGGLHCGMRWDGDHLITMLRVDRTELTPTLLGPAEIRTGAAVSLAEVARCLSQFDIRLAAVDVMTLAVRTRGPHHVVRLYEQLLGPLPATAERNLWLVLRFDPLDNAEAIANRGGAEVGMIRTALVATRRVAARLATRAVRVSVLTAEELAAVEATELHDTDPRQWRESWQALHFGGIDLAGYAVRPERLDSEVLATASALPGLATLTRLRMTSAIGPETPAQRADTVTLTALVRQDTIGAGRQDPEQTPEGLGLLPLHGRQRRVLLDGGQLDRSAAVYGAPAALARLSVPAGGCGPVLGATGDGLGVAIPLFGPSIRRVEIHGSLRFAQLMILRSIAVGAQVIVHSTRPESWDHMVDSVDSAAALSVSSPGGVQHTAAATMIVYDGVASAGQVSEATAVHIRARVSQAAEADVVLIESPDRPGDAVVRTAGGELPIHMVSVPQESGFLGVPEPAPAPELQPV
ncbi:type VII secretion protein EccE [Nocardia sp. NBC_01503]|uniref:type VII secretion protein EccE n=1 Tax=Nocardia sp. NBC_01503 TaxID=2975997 RepID=UPI002E7B7EBC|nr:type VII secretion protein EccE [Nocardia sp. NBC_01503]WTL29560.1 type VII secretion protein EccE [Nocardia sp. NBC_01503]